MGGNQFASSFNVIYCCSSRIISEMRMFFNGVVCNVMLRSVYSYILRISPRIKSNCVYELDLFLFRFRGLA